MLLLVQRRIRVNSTQYVPDSYPLELPIRNAPAETLSDTGTKVEVSLCGRPKPVKLVLDDARLGVETAQ